MRSIYKFELFTLYGYIMNRVGKATRKSFNDCIVEIVEFSSRRCYSVFENDECIMVAAVGDEVSDIIFKFKSPDCEQYYHIDCCADLLVRHCNGYPSAVAHLITMNKELFDNMGYEEFDNYHYTDLGARTRDRYVKDYKQLSNGYIDIDEDIALCCSPDLSCSCGDFIVSCDIKDFLEGKGPCWDHYYFGDLDIAICYKWCKCGDGRYLPYDVKSRMRGRVMTFDTDLLHYLCRRFESDYEIAEFIASNWPKAKGCVDEWVLEQLCGDYDEMMLGNLFAEDE